jgi:hypothetical protein
LVPLVFTVVGRVTVVARVTVRVMVVLLLLLDPQPAAPIAIAASNTHSTRAGALYLKDASFGRGTGAFYHPPGPANRHR